MSRSTLPNKENAVSLHQGPHPHALNPLGPRRRGPVAFVARRRGPHPYGWHPFGHRPFGHHPTSTAPSAPLLVRPRPGGSDRAASDLESRPVDADLRARGVRRGAVVSACAVSWMLAAAAATVLVAACAAAAALPDRLVEDAPRWAATLEALLEGLVTAAVLHIPVRRFLAVVRRARTGPAAHPARLAAPDLRDLGGRWAWWSRLSLTVPSGAAAAELVLRGWSPPGAFAVALLALAAPDLVALAARPFHVLVLHRRGRPGAAVTPTGARCASTGPDSTDRCRRVLRQRRVQRTVGTRTTPAS